MTRKLAGAFAAIALIVGTAGALGCGSDITEPRFSPPDDEPDPSDTNRTSQLRGAPGSGAALAAVLWLEEAPRG